jgi:hypothetical protein
VATRRTAVRRANRSNGSKAAYRERIANRSIFETKREFRRPKLKGNCQKCSHSLQSHCRMDVLGPSPSIEGDAAD